MNTLQETVRAARDKALAGATAEIADAERQYRYNVANYLREHPEALYDEVAARFHMSRSFIVRVAKDFKIERRKGRPKKG
ncbi:MAG TPA: hypothetical protein VMI10_24930 [Terriglobales bacterium]|nr:hypothetical protein [Terriglobales bacterium]